MDSCPEPSTRRLRRMFVVALLSVVSIAGVVPDASAADAGTEVVRDIIFPVVGTVRYSDTFGACRSGCSRTHEGEDLMAAKLTKLVATRDATVRWLKDTATPDGSQGNYVMLRDDDGWEYWYIHINNDSPGTDDGANPAEWRFGPGIERGARVRAGQLVGYVGDSGNAEWTAPHVHFEIRRPDGSVINPNPSLRAAVKLTTPVVPTEIPTPDEAFLRALSLDFLGREADGVRLTAGLAALGEGRSRRSVIDEYAGSDEWATALLTGFYQSTLGRGPDPVGLRNWLAALDRGMSPADVAARFYASDEYYRRSGATNLAWVTDLYREILLRDPDPKGLADWVRRVDAGESRTLITSQFYGSTESRQTRVAGLYRALLGRGADPTGMATWTRVLQNGRDIQLAATLASSAEYYARATRRSTS